MSRFPAVAGRAPRRQEEGERSRDLQEERLSAVCIADRGFSQHGMIGVTQPRKVAAISVAQRVAEEMKCTLGSKVGYQVRFDDCSSKETAIKYMTDGCLLKHILGDPNLTKFSVIILDEAHERTLTTDILFGLLKKLFQEKSPNRKEHLKVVVMSATMELAKLSAFFGNCPIFD
ncbi:DHX40 isoform 9, partial [Pan troglodytes]